MQMILSTKELDQIFTSVCVQKTRPTLAPVWELNLMADKELAGGQSSSYFLFSQNYINKGENYHLPPHNDFFWGKRNLMIVLGTNLARIYNFSAGSIIAIAAIVSHFKHSVLTGYPWVEILEDYYCNLVLDLSLGRPRYSGEQPINIHTSRADILISVQTIFNTIYSQCSCYTLHYTVYCIANQKHLTPTNLQPTKYTRESIFLLPPIWTSIINFL